MILHLIFRFFETLTTSLKESDLRRQKMKDKADIRKQPNRQKVEHDVKVVSTDISDRTIERSDSIEDLIQCSMFTCELDT